MAVRRIGLLILGLLGSLLGIHAMYISAQGLLYPETTIEAPIEHNASVPYDYYGIEIQDVAALPPAQITLPAPIEGTALIAQRLASYDGPYLEDGSDREVVQIAALMVYNAGTQEILQTGVTLEWGELQLCFYGENIPPGGTVLLLEQSRRSCMQTNFTACKGWQVIAQDVREPTVYLQITDSAMGEVTVKNISDSSLQDIRLYYKSWLSPPDIYVGGISRMISIDRLQPGESTTLYPSHYACGYTKIVSVSVQGT